MTVTARQMQAMFKGLLRRAMDDADSDVLTPEIISRVMDEHGGNDNPNLAAAIVDLMSEAT